jgi:hypothetical protein
VNLGTGIDDGRAVNCRHCGGGQHDRAGAGLFGLCGCLGIAAASA